MRASASAVSTAARASTDSAAMSTTRFWHGLELRQGATELAAGGGVLNRRGEHAVHCADALQCTGERASQDVRLDGRGGYG